MLGQPLRCTSNEVWKERVRRGVDEADVDRALPHVTGQTCYVGSMVTLSEGLARLVLGAGPGRSRSPGLGPSLAKGRPRTTEPLLRGSSLGSRAIEL